MDTLTYPPIQHPMYASQEDMEKGALSPVWALWFQQMQTHAVTYQSEQFFEVYSGEFTDNDPAPGSVSWDKIKVKYNGVRYAVNANGNTDKKYIYWESTNPRVLSAADALWLLTPTCILVGTNQSGTFVPEFYDSRRRVYNAIDEDGTVAAGKVDSFSLADLAVTEQKLANLAVTLQKLAAGAVDITKCASTIRPPEIFAVLPAAGNQGRLVYLTTDNKIYRDTGSVWTLEVDGNDLKAASVIAGKVAAGAIGTTELAAKAATINKLAVVPETLLPDPCFYDEDFWLPMYGGTQAFVPMDSDGANVAHLLSVPRCFYLTGADSTYTGIKTPPIPLTAAGKEIRFRFKAYNNADQTSWAGITFLNAAGADAGGGLSDTQAIGSGVSSVSLSGTVPTAAVSFFVWMRNNGAGMTGAMAFSDFRVELPATAELIVDGSITTNKIYAGAVTATKISVTSLSSLSANIGTVTAGIITGTTIRTTSDGSGNYMEISGTSMMGKDSEGSVLWSIDPQYGAFHLNDDSDVTGAKLGQNGYNNTTTWGVSAYNIEEGAYADDDGFNGRIVLGTSVPAGARYAIVRVWPNGTGSAFIVFRFGTVYIEQIVGNYYTYWDKKTDDYIQEHDTLYPSKLVYVPISRSALGKAYLYFAVLAPQPESIKAKLAGFII